MNKQDILNIKLGARQIPLVYEKDPVKEQACMGCLVREFAERHGEVHFHPFIHHVKETYGELTVGEILQRVFWLASDHEIEFRISDKNVAPYEVRKRLLESPDLAVSIVFHQPVEDVVLEEVQGFYALLTGRQAPPALPDPHDLSRLLAKQLRYWDDCLNFCKQGRKDQRFPGEEIISGGLSLIKKISVRLDPFSLIYAFHANGKKILELSGSVKTLYGFYTRYAKRWEALVNAKEGFEENLAELNAIAGVAENLKRLYRILLLEWPYDLVEEAIGLVELITPRHLEIIAEKTAKHRREATVRTDHLIAAMAGVTGDKRTVQEVRRQGLQKMRSMAQKITMAENIHAISRLTGEAEDLFEEFMEEIQQIP